MTAAHQARLQLAEALQDRLQQLPGLPGLTVYRGEVDTAVPQGAGGRVGPYAVIYSTAGFVDINPVLSGAPSDFLWCVQVNFVAGYSRDLEDLLDRAVPHLTTWMPVVEGLTCGWMRPERGYQPGPFRRNDVAVPPRFWLPTSWEVHVVASA